MSQINVSSTHPLENAVVLHNLAKYVNCPTTLRSCNSVSWGWRKQFIKSSTFGNLGKIICPAPNGLGYNRFGHAFDSIVTIKKIERLYVKDTENILNDEDVIDFLKIKGSYLKYISIETANIEWVTKVHVQFLENVLKYCSGLEELKLVGLVKERMVQIRPIHFHKNNSLKKLVLDYAQTCFGHQIFPLSLILSIIQFATKLESFVFVGFGYDMDLDLLQVITLIMQHIGKHSTNLTSLELNKVSCGHETFDFLVNADLPLRKFIFTGILHDGNASNKLNSFISAYEASLKHIEVEVFNFTKTHCRQIELLVHRVANLEVLKIDTENLNVGSSGLIGSLLNLRHLTLSGQNTQFDKLTGLDAMFRNGASMSLKSVCLDMRANSDDISKLLVVCPNILELEVGCLVRGLPEFVSLLRSGILNEGRLNDLTIKLYFLKSDICKHEWSKQLFLGLSSSTLKTLKIRAFGINFRQWIRKQWIYEGLSVSQNMFYFMGFECFNICSDEMPSVVRYLVGRARFVNLVECNVVNINTKGDLPLKNVQIYHDNMEDIIGNISRRVVMV